LPQNLCDILLGYLLRSGLHGPQGRFFEVEWPDFGIAETPFERRERERSIRDAVKFVASGRYIDVELTSEWVEHPVTGERIEVLGWHWPARGEDVPQCGEPVRRRTRSGSWTDYCERPAGLGTEHAGAGPCRIHESRLGPGTGAWIVAHAFARALEVTPWEGLLWAVKIAAGRVAFCEAKLSTATDDTDLEPDGALVYWVKQAELWHEKLARVSKLAVDAGVAERLVRQIELEAAMMLRATSLTMNELGLSEEQRELALGIMSRNLLALEAEQQGEVRNEA
jgi:hypothetical protein